MKRIIWLVVCLILLGCSCTSSDEKHLKALMNELGIEFSHPLDSNYVIIIPGNGCGRCIQDAINEIEEFIFGQEEGYRSTEYVSNVSQCLFVG